jgi:hypothetical protein
MIDCGGMDLEVIISSFGSIFEDHVFHFRLTAKASCKTTSPASKELTNHCRLNCLANAEGLSERSPVAIMLLLNAFLVSLSVKPASSAFRKNSASISWPIGLPGASFQSCEARRRWQELTVLEVYQPTTIDLNVSHRTPSCKIGDISMS